MNVIRIEVSDALTTRALRDGWRGADIVSGALPADAELITMKHDPLRRMVSFYFNSRTHGHEIGENSSLECVPVTPQVFKMKAKK